ncbi:hypothetical protein JTB14_017874 [Gonioctena quinquepunctata]|nr:hypothetical protein JTB14_017874 [Gonioctena quinquepunctata]
MGDWAADALPGEPGDVGLPGFSGQPGLPGKPGFEGLPGTKGMKGDRGEVGLVGLPGFNGPRGQSGEQGLQGLAGAKGYRGAIGFRGEPAPQYNGPTSRGFYFTRHSQSEIVPICPKNTVKMWEGYSLLHIMGNERAHGQDLGAPGSCLRKFNTMPFLFCNLNNVCDYAQRNEYSYWLSTTEPMPMTMTPIDAQNVQRYISRCSVCEAPTRVIAIHSQTITVPQCPNGWEELWAGYSFMMHTDSGAEGSGQSLVSPGSCLEEFRPKPFVECQAHGRCNYYTTAVSYWLATIEDYAMFRKPRPETLKAGFLTQKISRCAVCIRRFNRDRVPTVPSEINQYPQRNRPATYVPPQRYPTPTQKPIYRPPPVYRAPTEDGFRQLPTNVQLASFGNGTHPLFTIAAYETQSHSTEHSNYTEAKMKNADLAVL